MNISVIGLGKLGSVLAAVLAHKNHNVIGVDNNTEFVNLINRGQAPVEETGLAQLIAVNKSRLSATTSYKHAIENTDISMIIVPTPSNEQGTFALNYVESACKQIAAVLVNKKTYHLIVIVSTVMPGDTAKIQNLIEQKFGLTCGKDFGLCYNPEFIALGDIIQHMLNPDMILIGECDATAGQQLESVYKSIVENSPRYVRTNWVNAELIKLSVNTFVTTKISFANMLSEMCDKIPGANVDVVTAALGADRRIGSKYIKGAVAFGGPCFPRDNVAFSTLANELGVVASIADATHRINERQIDRLRNIVSQHNTENGTVGILGLSYKAGTNFVEKSTGIRLIHQLLDQNTTVVAYDPVAISNAMKEIKTNIFVDSVKTCFILSDVVVITTEWDQFKQIDPKWIRPQTTIIDCWGLLDGNQFSKICNYVRPGVN